MHLSKLDLFYLQMQWFYPTGCSSWHPTNSVKALKAIRRAVINNNKMWQMCLLIGSNETVVPWSPCHQNHSSEDLHWLPLYWHCHYDDATSELEASSPGSTTCSSQQNSLSVHNILFPSVLWHLLVGLPEEHPTCKKYEVLRCWCGYLSGARCLHMWSSWCHCHPIISEQQRFYHELSVHMGHIMLVNLCFSKIQNGLSFWYRLIPRFSWKNAIKQLLFCTTYCYRTNTAPEIIITHTHLHFFRQL